ncbi:MAG: YesL family protein [Lachnospiraceae bacterium]|nr:YesL family protein [Lachnospiraceae bacterium]
MASESKLFDPEGLLMTSFDTVKNLIILNLLTIICSLPIVTAGAAFTALHYSVLKMVRNEEGYISKNFFKSFKENLKQGIGFSVIMLLAGAFIGAAFYATLMFEEDPGFVKLARVLLVVMAVAYILQLTFFFPVQAKLAATLSQNMSNAFKMALSHFPMTLLMIVLNALPFVICYFFNFLIPVLLIFGFSLPAIWDAKLYDKIFKKLEDDLNAREDI